MGVHESNRGLCEALEEFYEHCLRKTRACSEAKGPQTFRAWGHELSATPGTDGEVALPVPRHGVSKTTQRQLSYEPLCDRVWFMLLNRECLKPSE
jgi:hypothetical protein